MKAALFAATVLIGSPAHADWQFTRWGMTPEQVVAASKGTASAAMQDQAIDRIYGYGRLGAKGRYNSGQYHFTVDYVFDNNELCQVRLQLQNTDRWSSLVQDLDGLYKGKQIVGKSLFGNPVWRDDDKANLVSYDTIPVQGKEELIVTVSYQRVRSNSSSGL